MSALLDASLDLSLHSLFIVYSAVLCIYFATNSTVIKYPKAAVNILTDVAKVIVYLFIYYLCLMTLNIVTIRTSKTCLTVRGF